MLAGGAAIGHSAAMADADRPMLPPGWSWSELQPYLEAAQSRSGEPETLERRLHRVVRRLPPATAGGRTQQVRRLQFLFELFLPSPFLSRILFADPELLDHLADRRDLAHFWSRQQLTARLSVGNSHPLAASQRLREHRRLLASIAACDVFHLLDLKTVTLQLSLLADATVQVALDQAANGRTDGIAVFALGKLGGEELNYSSDIDLLFVHADDRPAHPRLVAAVVDGLQQPPDPLYRVDLRLRPWGGSGPLIVSADDLLGYFRHSAAAWERQAYLKIRPIAGDIDFGSDVVDRLRPYVLSTPSVTADNVATQRRQILEAADQRRDIKGGRGSIRDIEFVVQMLQLRHGAERPEIIRANTLESLTKLADAGLLDAQEYRRLSQAYVFLRVVEHSLQLRQNLQTHELPSDAAASSGLAARLDFPTADEFARHLQRHRDAVTRVAARRLFGDGAVASDVDEVEHAVDDALLVSVRDRFEQSGSSAVEFDSASGQADRGAGTRLVAVITDSSDALTRLVRTLGRIGLSIQRGKAGRVDSTIDGEVNPRIELDLTVQIAAGTVPPVWDVLARQLEDRDQGVEDSVFQIAAWTGGEPATPPALRPVQIAIDRAAGTPQRAIIQIEADDSIGFLAEVSQALTIAGLRIVDVTIDTVNDRVLDRFTIEAATAEGRLRLEHPSRRYELRAAIVLAKHFTHLLPLSPNPSQSLLNFERFLKSLFERSDWIRDLAALQQSKTLRALANLLGVSDFLWHDFLRTQHANLFPVLSDATSLQTASSGAELAAELHADLDAATDWVAALNAFKDRAMLRADLRHLLGLERTFGKFSEELVAIAELVVDEALARLTRDRFASSPPRYAVAALGKCGGTEMGFASDIELLVVTDSDDAATLAELSGCVESLPQTIYAKPSGIFQLDFRLRPYGQAGPLAASLTAFADYFGPGGPSWPFERQSLVKLRAIAGDATLGRELEELRDAFVYGPGQFDLPAMQAMRQQQIRQKVGPELNVKLGEGGLVDIEYFVQALQIRFGGDKPQLRTPNTREALRRLTAAGLLTEVERLRLRDAYRFLRNVIDALRMVRGDARDLTVPPTGTIAHRDLRRRMRLLNDPDDIDEQLQKQMAIVRGLVATLPERLARPLTGDP